MITILAGLGSVILALIAFISHLESKNASLQAEKENQGVKDQITTNDAKIKANLDAIEAEKTALAEKEKNETNQSILDDLNSRK